MTAAFLAPTRAPSALDLPPRGGGGSPRVAVFTDKLDWHVERTLRALRAQGETPVAVRLSACKIETGRAHGLVIP
ncbi:MAG: RimK family alpha-L-glutamate ligase, partial [Methylocystis sp.]